MKRFFFSGVFLLFTGFCTLFNTSASAQSPSLSIIQMTFPDTAYQSIAYDTTIKVFIKNLSNNTSFTGSIAVLIQQDTLGAVIDTLISDSNQTIQAGAIITLSPSQYVFTPAVYRTGGNTVVVWPVGFNATTADSLKLDFFYIKISGIHNIPKENNMLFPAPNPATNYVILTGNKLPDEVRIFNLEGRIVYDEPYDGSRINIAAWRPGIYIVECRYRSQKSIFIKLVKL